MPSCSNIETSIPDRDDHNDIPIDQSDTVVLSPSKRRILVALPETSRLDGSSVHDFIMGKTLGTGSFGRVRHAIHRVSQECVALKILKKTAVVRLKQVDHIISEKNILRGLSHPFIVSLQGSFQDAACLYLALDYIPGGEFFTYLRRNIKLSAEATKFYGAQIVLIFEYLHQFKIVYRDLKPENILIDASGYLKLTDFGFAKIVNSHTYTLCGTPEYIAPEVLLNKGHAMSVDFWCLGILLYEMMNGYPPFIGEDTMSVYQRILSGKVYFGKTNDADAKFLIRNLLQADLTKRFGNMRSGNTDIKQCAWFSNVSWDDLFNKRLPAPHIPTLSMGTKLDTSNFEQYPDSKESTEDILVCGDPFVNW